MAARRWRSRPRTPPPCSARPATAPRSWRVGGGGGGGRGGGPPGRRGGGGGARGGGGGGGWGPLVAPAALPPPRPRGRAAAGGAPPLFQLVPEATEDLAATFGRLQEAVRS